MPCSTCSNSFVLVFVDPPVLFIESFGFYMYAVQKLKIFNGKKFYNRNTSVEPYNIYFDDMLGMSSLLVSIPIKNLTKKVGISLRNKFEILLSIILSIS